MTGLQLKAWALTVPDEAVIEVKRYEWEKIDHNKIRAIFICSPPITMDDMCNLVEEGG